MDTGESANHAQKLSSTQILLPYIIELIVSFLVFVVFLLSTWSLHYLGDILRTPRFVFFLRILELFVISFGTLLCVLFFLKASVEFLKKLIRLLKKQTKEVDSKHLHPRDIALRFGEPLHKRHLALFICSVLIIIVTLYVGISFAGLVQSNFDEVSLLACELMCETGPDFTSPIDPNYFGKILKNYAQYIENKQLSALLRIFPNYNPKVVLSDVNNIIVNAKGTQDEIANDIWRAGEEAMLFQLKEPRWLPRGIALYKYRKATELLLPLAEEALAASNEALKNFNNTPTMKNGVHSCECNRVTMILLFPLGASYDRPKVARLFTSFEVVVKECRNSKIDIANRIKNPDDARKEFLENIIAISEQRRLDILNDIKNRNMQEALERMLDAIEDSYNRRVALLELCEKVRNSGTYSKVIN